MGSGDSAVDIPVGLRSLYCAGVHPVAYSTLYQEDEALTKRTGA